MSTTSPTLATPSVDPASSVAAGQTVDAAAFAPVTVGEGPNALRVTVKGARFVASWKWDVAEGDVCGICRNAFEACCPTCSIPGDDCPPMWGGCNHAFHLHCIVKWLQTKEANEQKECPLCRRPWEEK